MADETTSQTQFQQRADMNLRLFDGNAEQWTIAHDKLREARSKGIPLQLEDILESDNNVIFGLTSEGLNPRLQQVLAEHPDRVATYRDQLPRLNAFANASDWASKTPEERTLEIQKLYHRKGIPLEKRKQYGNLRGTSGGTFSDASGRRVNPVSYLDACGASEREVITRAIETIRKQTGFDAGKLEGYDKLSDDGKKFVVGTALSHFKKVNALMAALQHEVGSNWRDMSDANLRKQITALSVNLNTDFSDIDTAALRKGDVTDVDYMEMLNVFGWRDIAKVGASAFGFTRSSEELAKIDANSPLEDQLALLEHLKQQSLGMRGLDFWGDVANAVAVSTPYILEFLATGGVATVGKLSARAAVRQALKAGGVEGVRGIATAMFRKEGRAALGKAAGAILTAEAKRAPFLLPKNIAQAIEEADSGPVYLPGEDGLKTVVPQAKVDQVVTLALRNVLRDYISRTTEWSGELLPDVNLLSRMIPKKYKNKLASLILRDVTASADPTKVGIVTRALLDDLPLSGDVTEFLEEKIDQAAQYGATKLSEIVGVKALDMEQDTLVGSWQDNLKTFVSVAVSTNAFRAARLAGKVGTVRDIARIVDDHRAMADAASNIPLESRSVVQSREFYDYVRGGDRMFYLDADDAMTFLQSDPEFAASCGITEETVNASDRDGVFVQVSENTLLAERAKSPAASEAGERLLSLVRQSGIPVGDALTVDVGEEVVQEYKAQQERINRFRNKFQAAFAAAEAAGVSRTAIQKNAELVSRVLNMFADNLDSDERIEKALDGLLTQMVEDPENFSGSYRPVYLTEETEEIVRSLENIAPPTETVEATEATETKRDPLEELDDETVRKYTPFIDKAVNFFKEKYSSLTLDEGEMVTIAWSAFARAKQSFNPESGAKFSTYASKAIGNAIQKYTKKVSNRGETSLNTSLDEDGTGRQDFITDTSAGADEALASAEDASKAAAVAREWVKSLTPGQRRILRMVFSGTSTQAEIAEKLAVSKQAVSKTIARITEAVAKSGIPGPELMASLKELAENDDKLFEQRDTFLQEDFVSTVSDIPRPETIAPLPPELQAEIERQKAEVRKTYKGDESDVTIRTRFFKDFFGDWEAAPPPRHKTDDRSQEPSALTRAHALQGADINIIQSGEKSNDVSKVVDNGGKPLRVYHGTTARFHAFRRGDIGFHFGTREQAENRVSEEDWNNIDGYFMTPVENAGVLSGYLNIRNPLYIPADFGDWHGDMVAEKLLYDYRYTLPFELTESDINFLIKTANSTSKLADNDMRKWLSHKGFDGIVYENAVEGDGLSYIIFSPAQFKSADNLGTFSNKYANFYYQEEGILRGATQFGDYFDSNYRAIITLFKGNANASTLVHESAHWLKGLMKVLCDLKDSDGNFIADDTLREEYASIEKWLDAQTYKSAAGTKEYTIEREEKFARAFEYYIMNGKAPSAGVASAFDTLKRYLCRIYQSIVNGFEKEFGFVLSDDIRGVFDRMLSTQNTLDRESPLREAAGILRETFSGLLGLSQDETRDIQKLIKLADTQMANEIDRHKTKLLPEFRRIWKKEAEGARNELRVYRAIADAVKGKDADGRLDTKVLAADGVSEDDINALRARGLAVRNGANPADLVSKHQYSSIQELVRDILSNPTPKEFVDNYMKEQEEQLFRDMELDEKTLSVSAIRQVLDTLSGLLAVKGGKEGYVIRKGEAENAALKTLGEMQVSDVINDRTHIRSLKEHASILTNAISKQDYLTALDRIDQIRKLVAVLKEKGDAKKRVSVIQDKLRKAVKAKKGTIYGDYHDALKELAYYFGFTRRKPEQPKENFRKKVMEQELSDDLSDGFMWESFLLSDKETRYKDLKYADFELLANLVEHLYGTGKDLVAEAKGSFGARAQERRDAIVASLSKLPARYDRRRDSSRVASLGRSLLHVGENLRVLLGRADGFSHVGTGESGPCLALRDILVPAVSEAVALESETLSQVKAHLDALWASRDRVSLPPPHFRFTGRGLTYGYSKWTPEMVIAACLNLGNEVNRDRLVRGYGWESLDLNDIASCVPADLWQHIQGIWNAIGGKLQEKSAETFFKENHYRMRLVVPDGMGVHYLNGKSISFEGGYYPIRYAHRAKSKSTVVPSHMQGLYAQVSSTMLRSERIDNPEPLELSLSGLLKHIHETSFYAATRLACRDVLAVFRSSEVEDAFGSTQSFEAYNMVHNLLRNIANPDALTEGTGGDGGFMDTFEKWSKTAMTAGALMGNISSVLKQPASLTVGANETGTFFLDAIAAYSQNPVALTDKVKQLSAMMRDRIDYTDPDLKSAATRFGKSGVERTRETMSRIGYAAMRFMDGAVAVPVWYSKYLQIESRLTAEGKLSSADIVKQAAAEADDFIARTQGAGRTLDLTPIQLDRIGRLISPFITAASAQYNTAIENLGAIRAGRMTSGEALMAITLNILAPAVYSSLVIAVLNGALSDDDDDIDRAMKAALTELLSSPFSGFPLVRDVGQYVAGAAVDRALGGKKSYRPELFDVSSFEAVNRVFKGLSESAESTLEGDFGRAAWKAADAFGSAAGVPAIRIYERTMRQYKRSGGELPELLSKLEEVTKQKRKGAER